jgi:hypothetical protein
MGTVRAFFANSKAAFVGCAVALALVGVVGIAAFASSGAPSHSAATAATVQGYAPANTDSQANASTATAPSEPSTSEPLNTPVASKVAPAPATTAPTDAPAPSASPPAVSSATDAPTGLQPTAVPITDCIQIDSGGVVVGCEKASEVNVNPDVAQTLRAQWGYQGVPVYSPNTGQVVGVLMDGFMAYVPDALLGRIGDIKACDDIVRGEMTQIANGDAPTTRLSDDCRQLLLAQGIRPGILDKY